MRVSLSLIKVLCHEADVASIIGTRRMFDHIFDYLLVCRQLLGLNKGHLLNSAQTLLLESNDFLQKIFNLGALF